MLTTLLVGTPLLAQALPALVWWALIFFVIAIIAYLLGARGVAGMSAGVLRLFAGRPSLARVVPELTGRLAGVAAIGYLLFVLVASVMIWQSNLILIE